MKSNVRIHRQQLPADLSLVLSTTRELLSSALTSLDKAGLATYINGLPTFNVKETEIVRFAVTDKNVLFELSLRDRAFGTGTPAINASNIVELRGLSVTSFNELTDLPSTFAPSAHTHSMSEISGLTGELDTKATKNELTQGLSTKANTTHTHEISEVNGLVGALSGKANATHTHVISEVNGLADALDTKATADALNTGLATKSDIGHTHSMSEVNGLVSELSTKATKTELIDGLATKAALNHTHVISEVNGLQVALDGKAALAHTHSMSEVTGLVGELDTKATKVELNSAVAGLSASISNASGDLNAAITAGDDAVTAAFIAADNVVRNDFAAADTAVRNDLSNAIVAGDNAVRAELASAVSGITASMALKADLVNGTVPASQLPSFVDDVLEFANLTAFPGTGEMGKIYVALDTNKTYRWSGSSYIYITSGAVDTVNGQAGVVVLGTDQVNEGLTNLYYTDARVQLSPFANFTKGALINLEDVKMDKSAFTASLAVATASIYGVIDTLAVASQVAASFSNVYTAIANVPTTASFSQAITDLWISQDTQDERIDALSQAVIDNFGIAASASAAVMAHSVGVSQSLANTVAAVSASFSTAYVNLDLKADKVDVLAATTSIGVSIADLYAIKADKAEVAASFSAVFGVATGAVEVANSAELLATAAGVTASAASIKAIAAEQAAAGAVLTANTAVETANTAKDIANIALTSATASGEAAAAAQQFAEAVLGKHNNLDEFVYYTLLPSITGSFSSVTAAIVAGDNAVRAEFAAADAALLASVAATASDIRAEFAAADTVVLATATASALAAQVAAINHSDARDAVFGASASQAINTMGTNTLNSAKDYTDGKITVVNNAMALKADLVGGVVPASQLPSFVDDVLEFANLTAFPATGEFGKIYVALDTNKVYRWSGSSYIYITSGAVDTVNGQTGVVVINHQNLQTAEFVAPMIGTASADLRAEFAAADVAISASASAAIAAAIAGVNSGASASAAAIRAEFAAADSAIRVDFASADSAIRAEFAAADAAVTAAFIAADNLVRADFAAADAVVAANATAALNAGLATKQDTLVSGTNIATINGQSILAGTNFETVTDSIKKDEFMFVGTQSNVFTVSQDIRQVVSVTVNGVELRSADYAKGLRTITIPNDDLHTGDSVIVTYNANVLGSVSQAFVETPVGVVDGANKVFTIANNVDGQAWLIVTINGITKFDYSYYNKVITFNNAPAAGSDIKVQYFASMQPDGGNYLGDIAAALAALNG